MTKNGVMNTYEFASYSGYTYVDLFDDILKDKDGMFELVHGHIHPREIIWEEQKKGHGSIAENYEKRNERKITRFGEDKWIKESIRFHLQRYESENLEQYGLTFQKVKGQYRFMVENEKRFVKYINLFIKKLSGTELKNIEITLNEVAEHCSKKLSLAIKNFGNKKMVVEENKPQLPCKGASLMDYSKKKKRH